VDLGPQQKGAHMSRFEEVLGERVRHHVTKREWLEDVSGPETA
jgi:GTP cyclohydrolase FolE2